MASSLRAAALRGSGFRRALSAREGLASHRTFPFRRLLSSGTSGSQTPNEKLDGLLQEITERASSIPKNAVAGVFISCNNARMEYYKEHIKRSWQISYVLVCGGVFGFCTRKNRRRE